MVMKQSEKVGKRSSRLASISVSPISSSEQHERGKPQVYKDKDYEINASNLCTGIALPATPDESFVCCLSQV